MPGTTWQKDCRESGYPLVSSWGWVLTALLHISPESGGRISTTAGGPEVSEYVVDIPGHDKHYNYTVGAIKSVSAAQKKLTYLVLLFSPDPDERNLQQVQLEVSASDLTALQSGWDHEDVNRICDKLKVVQQAHNRSTAVHDQIESQLYENGLKETLEKRSVDAVVKMATPAGLAMIAGDAAGWMESNRKSLRFQPFDGAVNSIPATHSWAVNDGNTTSQPRLRPLMPLKKGCVLSLQMETPSMVLLEITL